MLELLALVLLAGPIQQGLMERGHASLCFPVVEKCQPSPSWYVMISEWKLEAGSDPEPQGGANNSTVFGKSFVSVLPSWSSASSASAVLCWAPRQWRPCRSFTVLFSSFSLISLLFLSAHAPPPPHGAPVFHLSYSYSSFLPGRHLPSFSPGLLFLSFLLFTISVILCVLPARSPHVSTCQIKCLKLFSTASSVCPVLMRSNLVFISHFKRENVVHICWPLPCPIAPLAQGGWMRE